MWMRHNPLHYLLIAGSLISSSCRAVFQDEAFHTDFQVQLFGTPLDPSSTFFHQASAGKAGSLLYTLTNRLVIGAINPKDGSQVWRQQLAQGTVSETEKLSKSASLRKSKDGRVVSIFKKTVSLWDAATGRAVWEYTSGLDIADAITLEKENLLLVAFKAGEIKAFKLESGEILWENIIGEGRDIASNFNYYGEKLYLTLDTPATGRLKTVIISPATGTQLEEFSPDVFGKAERHVSTPQLLPITAYSNSENLKFNVLGTKNVKPVAVSSNDHEYRLHAVNKDTVFVEYWSASGEAPTSWADFYTIEKGTVKKVLDLPYENEVSVFSLSDSGSGLFVTRVSRWKIRVYGEESNTPVQVFDLGKSLAGEPLHVAAEVVKRRDGQLAVRAVITVDDGNVVLIRNGEVIWTRQDALASAVSAEFVDLHEVEDSLEQALHAEEASNVVTAYFKRVTRHIHDLQYLPGWILSFQQSILGIFGAGEKSTTTSVSSKDTFGFRKLVVFVTRFGWVTAIDTTNQGQVVWSLPLLKPKIMEKDIKGIFHFGKGIILVVLSSGDYYIVDCINGKGLKKSAMEFLPTASVMAVESANGDKKWIVAIPVKEGAKGWFFPDENSKELDEVLSKTALSQKCDTGICGYSAKTTAGGRLILTPTWTFRPPPAQKIVSINTRPAHDPIASIGKVLGDRSVMYKYVNPQLMLLITVTPSTSTAYLYLLDSVSGAILHTSIQEEVDTTRPIVATMAENWYVYSYHSKSSAKGTHVVVTDFYASANKNDPGSLAGPNMSSFDQPRSTSPYGISHAFIFPHPIAALGTTTTRQGITTRSVLFSVPSIGSLISINKRILEPRRPVGRDPNNEEKEEGLFKYEPWLGIDHQRGSLSHVRELVGISKIITTPSLLESTSIVVGWGIDVFGTRTSPSEAFDVLGRGFNKITLIGSVIAVWVGAIFVGPMVRKKQINQRWGTQ